MNNGIDLFIGKEQLQLCGTTSGIDTLEFSASPAEFAEAFALFSKDNDKYKQRPLTIYLRDDLVYFTHISLPKQTPNVEKAINLQLDMLSPFGEDCLFAHEIKHEKEAIHVALYLVAKETILPILEVIYGLEWRITGMYPESQRGLNKDNRKKTWGLLSPGLFKKLTIFKTGQVSDRLQIPFAPTNDELKKTYQLEFIQDISSLAPLASPPPAALQFDLLPAFFRRTDYYKWTVMGLIGVNVILGLFLLIMSFISLQGKITTIEDQQAELRPQLQEIKKLKKQRSQQNKKLKAYSAMGQNKDLIKLLDTLTRELPTTSYLDQLRLDKGTGAIHIQGYTNDLSNLTTSLQVIGNATLESTRKRKGQTYFQIEVLPK